LSIEYLSRSMSLSASASVRARPSVMTAPESARFQLSYSHICVNRVSLGPEAGQICGSGRFGWRMVPAKRLPPSEVSSSLVRGVAKTGSGELTGSESWKVNGREG
jgi:hypothetical protein